MRTPVAFGKLESALEIAAQPAEPREIGGSPFFQSLQNGCDHFIELVGRFGMADARLPRDLLCKIGIPHLSLPMLATGKPESGLPEFRKQP